MTFNTSIRSSSSAGFRTSILMVSVLASRSSSEGNTDNRLTIMGLRYSANDRLLRMRQRMSHTRQAGAISSLLFNAGFSNARMGGTKPSN